LGNNKIVRTSKTPGCTKNVNFYAFVTQKGVKSTYLVDLPGYGYAKTSKEDREDWVVMIKKYLVARDLSVLR
jgi:GTP-binding protein